MKNRFSLALVMLLAFALLLPASFVFAQQSRDAAPSRRQTQNDPLVSRRRASGRAMSEATADVEKDFAEALSIVQDNYIDGKKLDYNNVFKSSIIGMLRTLDPHSNYYDKAEFDEMKTEQRSEYFGIGALIGNERLGDTVDTYILSTLTETAPAAKAGLRYGDKIVEVDGEKMQGKSTAEVRDKIRGPRGSSVKVLIERAATGKTEIVEITRDAVPQPSIPDAYMLKPGVGYIGMTQGFNYTTADELQAALDYLRSKGMTSLVLDLRNNPGGFLDQALQVSSKFLQPGQIILTQKGRNDQKTLRASEETGKPDNTPLVILINGNTASASEIVAGAMQDHDRALIVGETSFGKGLVQGIWPLEYGAGLTLTSAKYYTPSGRLIQRDYTNEGFYDYYTKGGTLRLDQKDVPVKPTGPESRTDTGRAVYGGGGISPDEAVKPKTINSTQVRLQTGPLFFFTRELINGRIQGLDSFKIQRAIDFDHELKATDYAITDAVFKAFKDYTLSHQDWWPGTTAAQLDRNRQFIETQLRYNIITAAYGKTTADQIFINDDPQVAKAIDVLPRARELSMTAATRARIQP